MNLQKIVKGAAIIAALFICEFSFSAKKNIENLETYRDQISKSQVLLLQRDRLQASQILISAITKEGLKSPAYIELTKALKKSLEVFFSERAQQSYEMAISIYSTSRNQFIEKLLETNSIEPQNSTIIKGIIFSYLSINECNKANHFFQEITKLNPYDEESPKIRLLVAVCQKNKSEILSLIGKLDQSELNEPFWLLNKVRGLGIESIPTPINTDTLLSKTGNPELVYHLLTTEKEFKKKLALSERYKNQCHVAIPFNKAYSWLEPWACEHVKEVEESISKFERGQ